MIVWITKYALTQGIFRADAEVTLDLPNMATIYHPGGLSAHFHGKDWHTTEADALKRAEDMRKQKIESLYKKIYKLERLKFTP
jgi:hypothetical protein